MNALCCTYRPNCRGALDGRAATPTTGGATEPLSLTTNSTRIRRAAGPRSICSGALGICSSLARCLVGDAALTEPAGARPGDPLRYVEQAWPIDAYQTVFADEPGSAEMPSAARPFTTALVTALVGRGVASRRSRCTPACRRSEGTSCPYPERFEVPPPPPPRRQRRARPPAVASIAVGTTVVRGAGDGGRSPDGRSAADRLDRHGRHSRARPAGRRRPDHRAGTSPTASHLRMLEAVAGPPCSSAPTRQRDRRLPLARVRRPPPDPPLTAGAVRRRACPDPVARAGAAPGGAVLRVRELAAAQGEAAAADALGQPELEPLELGDPVVDARGPGARQAAPVTAVRRAVGRQLGQLALISSSDNPTRWANTMKAIRRSTGRA